MPFRFGTRKTTSSACIGLSLHADGFACCIVDRAGGAIVGTHYQATLGNISLLEALAQWVRDHNLKGHICHVSLSPDDYKLLSAEVPAVPEAEINQALLWGLRDVIDGKPEEIVLDSFASASGIHRSGQPLRQIVTARKARIRAIAEAVLGAGLELGIIEIPELSQRNIVARLQDSAIGVGVVSQNSRGVSLAIYRGDELYVSRHLAGIANLNDAGHPLTAPRLAEQLGLELLRTLDYYDSQLRQRPPAAIFLQPLAIETRPLLDNLSATVNLPIKQLHFADAQLTSSNELAAEIQERCFIAFGAALRNEADAKQQINLYTDEFRPQRQWLTPQRCAQLWGTALAAGLLIAGALAWRGHNLQTEAAALQAQLQTEQTELANAQAQLAARVPSPELTAELQHRKAETAAKAELLAALATRALTGRQGYTPILTSLAHNTVDGLWLTDIEIHDNDVNLTGAARNADLIPLYIDQIVNAADFGPRGYESLDIKTAENNLLTFALRGHRSSDNLAAAQP